MNIKQRISYFLEQSDSVEQALFALSLLLWWFLFPLISMSNSYGY